MMFTKKLIGIIFSSTLLLFSLGACGDQGSNESAINTPRQGKGDSGNFSGEGGYWKKEKQNCAAICAQNGMTQDKCEFNSMLCEWSDEDGTCKELERVACYLLSNDADACREYAACEWRDNYYGGECYNIADKETEKCSEFVFIKCSSITDMNECGQVSSCEWGDAGKCKTKSVDCHRWDSDASLCRENPTCEWKDNYYGGECFSL